MSQKFDMQKSRELAMKCAFWNPMPDELLPEFVAALDRIEALEKAISEPVEAFGTTELIAWNQELARLLDVPEEERGGIAFVISVGCHLEKFAKSWRSSPAWQITKERKEALDLLCNLAPDHEFRYAEIENEANRAIELIRDMLAETEAGP